LAPLFASVGFGLGMGGLYIAKLVWMRLTWSGVDAEGKTVRNKSWQAPGDGSAKRGVTQYGKEAFPPERPPIEKLWAEYQSEHAVEDSVKKVKKDKK